MRTLSYDGSLKFDTAIDDKGIQEGMQNIGNVAQKGMKAAAAAIGGAVAALTAMGTASVKVGASFEAGMSKVQAISGASGEDLQALTEKAKEMGASTKFSATESANAFEYMAMAGWKTEDMLSGIEGIMNLAAASGEELATTSDIVTDALTAFGLSASDSGHFADILAQASSNANTNVGLMGETFKYVAPLAGALGYSAEDTATAIGLMANAGIKGSQAGTALRSIMTRLVKPTKESSTAMKDLGLSVTDSSGKMKPLNEIVKDMRSKFAGLTEAEKGTYAAMLGGQEAMSGLLAIVNAADSDFGKLEEAIYSCNGAAAQMADTMNDNLQGSVTILQSGLEGLGISVYEIFEGTMKDGVSAATKAVDNLQRSITDGELGISLNRLAEAVGELAGEAINAAEKALPKLIDGFVWLLDNGDLIVPIIFGVVTAWTAYKAVNESAAIAQGLLNAAMMANPAVLLTSAVIALTAATAAYCFINKDSINQYSEQAEKTRTLIEETKALNDAYAESSEKRKQTIADFESQSTMISDLVSELGSLRAKTSLTADEQARMATIVSELNQLVPDLNLVYDEQANTFNKTQREIDNCVEAYMTLYRAQAAQEELQGIAQQQIEFEKQLRDLEKQREEQVREVEEATRALSEATEDSTAIFESNGQSLDGAQNRLIEAKQALAELDDTTRVAKENNNALTEDYEYWKEVVADNQPVYDAATAENALSDGAQNAAGAMTDMAGAASQAFQDMYSKVSETVSEQLSLFDEFNGKAALTTQELLGNMQSQVDGVSQWADNLEELSSRGIDQGLLQHLADMGPEGAGYVATFVSMTDEELQKANELFEQALALPTDTASKVAQSYEEAGQQAVEGFKIGLDENVEKIAESGKNVGEQAEKATKTELEEHSPSRKTKEIGENFDLGLIQGVKGKQLEVLNAVTELAMQSVAKAKEGLAPPKFEEIGRQIPAGIAQGVRNGQGELVKAIAEACEAAVKKAQESLKINSPSRRFDEEVGQLIPPGIGVGVRKAMPDLKRQMETDLSNLAARMRATVEAETYRVTLRYEAQAQNRADTESQRSGDTYIDNHVEQENNYHAAVVSPAETSRNQREAVRNLVRGIG